MPFKLSIVPWDWVVKSCAMSYATLMSIVSCLKKRERISLWDLKHVGDIFGCCARFLLPIFSTTSIVFLPTFRLTLNSNPYFTSFGYRRIGNTDKKKEALSFPPYTVFWTCFLQLRWRLWDRNDDRQKLKRQARRHRLGYIPAWSGPSRLFFSLLASFFSFRGVKV